LGSFINVGLETKGIWPVKTLSRYSQFGRPCLKQNELWKSMPVKQELEVVVVFLSFTKCD